MNRFGSAGSICSRKLRKLAETNPDAAAAFAEKALRAGGTISPDVRGQLLGVMRMDGTHGAGTPSRSRFFEHAAKGIGGQVNFRTRLARDPDDSKAA